MANVKRQHYVNFPGSRTVGIHEVQVETGALEQFTVAKLSNSTTAQSCAGLGKTGQTKPTVANGTDAFTVDVTGTAGETYVIVTLHEGGNTMDEE